MKFTTRFRPKLFELGEGYSKERFFKDLGAGLTVAVVALPLAMAFAIASGLKPEAGLFTAIIAGFLISLFSGSRVQIGGPAGAFIVIVYGIVEQYGVGGLLLATFMSGVMLWMMGFLRMGILIKFIPVAVIIGFTNGIAVLIGLSQIKDFLGLQIEGKMPAEFFALLQTLWQALPTWNGQALAVAHEENGAVERKNRPAAAHVGLAGADTRLDCGAGGGHAGGAVFRAECGNHRQQV